MWVVLNYYPKRKNLSEGEIRLIWHNLKVLFISGETDVTYDDYSHEIGWKKKK